MNQDYKNLVAYVRIDGLGQVVPGSLTYKKRGTKIADGRWVQVLGNYCCDGCFCTMTFTNSTTHADITAIRVTNGDMSFDTTLESGDTYVMVLPNCYNYTIEMDLSTPDANIEITATTEYGSGEVTVDPDEVASSTETPTITITTTADGCSQYAITIVDA